MKKKYRVNNLPKILTGGRPSCKKKCIKKLRGKIESKKSVKKRTRRTYSTYKQQQDMFGY